MFRDISLTLSFIEDILLLLIDFKFFLLIFIESSNRLMKVLVFRKNAVISIFVLANIFLVSKFWHLLLFEMLIYF